MKRYVVLGLYDCTPYHIFMCGFIKESKGMGLVALQRRRGTCTCRPEKVVADTVLK
jgi:hypothetical protein